MLEDISHCYSADPLINLANSSRWLGEKRSSERSQVLVLSLSPFSWGAAVMTPV